jgi:prepilin-type N-terminal cleavage/methylation domain-containing protein
MEKDPEMTMFRRTSKEAFTLVEMMVVVAITAVIAMIAVPNYRKYSSASRQAEARTALSVIYSLERTFSAEIGSFGACLKEMSYTPENSKALRYYTTGFWPNAGVSAQVDCGPKHNQPCLSYLFDYTGVATSACSANATDTCSGASTCFVATANMGYAGTPASVPSGGYASGFTFTAHAYGNIVSENKMDFWQIDQNKNLLNVSSGI